jgi:hypothetical protein
MILFMEIKEAAPRGIQLPMIGSHQSKQGFLCGDSVVDFTRLLKAERDLAPCSESLGW